MNVPLTFTILPVASALFTVIAFFVPKFNLWFTEKSGEYKQLFMLGLIVLAGGGAAVLSYFGFLDIYSGVTWQEWVWFPIVDIGYAVIAQAGVYKGINKIGDKYIEKIKK